MTDAAPFWMEMISDGWGSVWCRTSQGEEEQIFSAIQALHEEVDIYPVPSAVFPDGARMIQAVHHLNNPKLDEFYWTGILEPNDPVFEVAAFDFFRPRGPHPRSDIVHVANSRQLRSVWDLPEGERKLLGPYPDPL